MATIPLPYPRRLALAEAPSPPLFRFVALSLLLHVLIVMLFGTPERAGIRGGAFWRDEPLAVTLRPPAAERESMWRPSFGAESGGTGSALSRRAPASGAPAPSQRTAPAPEPAAPAENAAPVERTIEAPLPQEAPLPHEGPLPQEAPTPGTLPRLDLGAPEIVDKPIVPEVGIRPQEAPTPAEPRVELEPALPESPPPAAPPRREAPPPAQPMVDRPTPLQRLPEIAPKIELAAPAEPPLEPLRSIETEAPAELTPLLRVPEPEPFVAPRPAAEPAPSAEPAKPAEAAAKREAPPEAVLPAEPQATPNVAPRERAPVTETPRSPPDPVVAPSRERAPAPAEPIATPAPSVAPREAPAASPPMREAPAIESEPYRAAPVPVPPTRPPIREAPSPPTRLNYGAPSEDDIFAPRAPPSVSDVDAARRAAREVRAESQRTGIVPLNLFPPPPEKESKLARDIQKAAQPDCRDAYAAMGLLAIPFLLKDTVTDTGCRW